jgi:hypothetical protein
MRHVWRNVTEAPVYLGPGEVSKAYHACPYCNMTRTTTYRKTARVYRTTYTYYDGQGYQVFVVGDCPRKRRRCA